MATEDIKPKKSWLTEGVILALVPAVAYFIAFRYESGYAEHFGIPNELIEVTLTNVLTAVFAIYSFLFTFFSLLFILPLRLGPITRSFIRLSPIILLFFVFPSIWIMVILIIFSFLEFVMPLLTQPHIKGYRNKLEVDEEAESSFQETRLVGWITERIGKTNWIVILLLILVLFLSGIVGRLHASKKIDFLVIPESPETVVLRIYGDKLICSTFDRNTKKIEKKFSIMKTSDIQNTMLILEEIGPLSIQKKPLQRQGYLSIKKTIIQYKYQIMLFIAGLSLLLLIIRLHKAGVFRTVQIEKAIRGPYKVVSLNVIGYKRKQLSSKIQEAKKIVNELDITSHNLCFIYYDYFKTTPLKDQKINAGILINASQPLDEKVIIENGLQLETIAERDVIVGRLEGSLSMVYFKIIPKILKWMKKHDVKAGEPVIQILLNDQFIEVEVPVSNRVTYEK